MIDPANLNVARRPVVSPARVTFTRKVSFTTPFKCRLSLSSLHARGTSPSKEGREGTTRSRLPSVAPASGLRIHPPLEASARSRDPVSFSHPSKKARLARASVSQEGTCFITSPNNRRRRDDLLKFVKLPPLYTAAVNSRNDPFRSTALELKFGVGQTELLRVILPSPRSRSLDITAHWIGT